MTFSHMYVTMEKFIKHVVVQKFPFSTAMYRQTPNTPNFILYIDWLVI